ncbi:DUF1674 domain-containing protein [Dokdonella sp.]|uniref:DUF1674 domain-containing protein n=1 Tax=Dokdonella sp. TaxID=2291710 RepID=UPI0025C25485|nr:DUF1674 domain-containing protein [Dokdonella sp.]MBX3688115.1 DUF1674 domain-containing protein [Dokdonella sp.]
MTTSDPITPESAKLPPVAGEADAPRAAQPGQDKDRRRLDPVRYGDWEKDGRCIDF